MTYTRRVVVDRERFRKAVLEGLTNPELAERFGIPKTTVNEWAARVRAERQETR